MPAKKLPKYKPIDLELIKDNPFLLKKEMDAVIRFINSDYKRFTKKGIMASGRRTRKKLLRLRTVALHLYRAIGLLQEERKENLKEIKQTLIYNREEQ
jgi:hypothetical protein